jgi:hypothetical protein
MASTTFLQAVLARKLLLSEMIATSRLVSFLSGLPPLLPDVAQFKAWTFSWMTSSGAFWKGSNPVTL